MARPSNLTYKQEDDLCRDYLLGNKPVMELVAEYGISTSGFYSLLDRRQIPLRYRKQNANCKSVKQHHQRDLKIVRDYANGKKIMIITRKYKISFPTLYKILKRYDVKTLRNRKRRLIFS